MSMLKNVPWVEKMHRLCEYTLISFKCQSIRSKVHCTNKTLHNESLKNVTVQLGRHVTCAKNMTTVLGSYKTLIFQRNFRLLKKRFLHLWPLCCLAGLPTTLIFLLLHPLHLLDPCHEQFQRSSMWPCGWSLPHGRVSLPGCNDS